MDEDTELLSYEEQTDDEVYVVMKVRKLYLKKDYHGSKKFIVKR